VVLMQQPLHLQLHHNLAAVNAAVCCNFKRWVPAKLLCKAQRRLHS
jgi:hypothetical protein